MSLPPIPQIPPGTKRWPWTLTMCMCAVFAVGADNSIVNAALPALSAELGIGSSEISWMVTANSVAMAAALVVVGAVADSAGRVRVFAIGVVATIVAAVVAATASSLALLVVVRAFQGLSAAAITPVALSLLLVAYPQGPDRGRAVGAWAAAGGMSIAAGPIIGGLVVEFIGWRGAFLATVPLLLAAGLIAVLAAPRPARSATAVDLPGGLLFALAAGGTVAVVNGGGALSRMPMLAVVLVTIVVLAVLALVIVERRSIHPVLDPALFSQPSFVRGLIVAATGFLALGAFLMTSSFLLQQDWGLPPLAAGMATLPLGVASAVASHVAGRRIGRGRVSAVASVGGVAVMSGAAAMALAGMLPTFAAVPAFFFAAIAVGIGHGATNAAGPALAMSRVEPVRSGTAAGVVSTARQLGIGLGVALVAAFPAPVGRAAFIPWLIIAVVGGVAVLLLTLTPSVRRPALSPVSKGQTP